MGRLFWRWAILGALVFMTMILLLGFIGLQNRLGKADIAVVPAAYVKANGQPSARLRARLQKTAELYKQGYFSTIIVSGGVSKNGFDDPAIMKTDLLRYGIPPQHILIDDSGYSTYLTAQNTAHFMRKNGIQSVFIVSQYFHLPRTRFALYRFGVPVVYYAHANHFEWRDMYFLPREVCAIIYYAFRTYEEAENR